MIEKASRRRQSSGFALAMPTIFWLGIFFMLPLLIMLVASFLTRGSNLADYSTPVTGTNYEAVFTEPILPILRRSIIIALETTIICFLIGYPFAYFISTRQQAWVRNLSLFMVILPFWTNFLVRTYAWQIIIGRRGIINEVLMNQLGIIDRPLQIINTEGAVLIGLVYGFLPFMVLPIYASLERFNFRLVEAANDLGANDWVAFWRVIFPISLPGVVAGWILVFIPSIGAFVTPTLLGGVRGFMIGNQITALFRDEGGSWPRGSAASIVIMAIVMLSLIVYQRFANEESYQKTSTNTLTLPPLIPIWLADSPQWVTWVMMPLLVVLWAFSALNETFWFVLGAVLSFISQLISARGERRRRLFRRILSLFHDSTDDAKTDKKGFEVSQWKIRRDLVIRRAINGLLMIVPIFCYIFLWAPIVLLVVYSFNASSRASGQWQGFSTIWYDNIFAGVAGSRSAFSTDQMLESVETTLIISVAATVLATIIGTMVAISLERGRYGGKRLIDSMLYLPIVIPDITMGISLLVFFKWVLDAVETLFHHQAALQDTVIPEIHIPGIGITLPGADLGMVMVVIGHVAFNISFVAIVVRARLTDMNPRYEEAARDLGATEWRTFRYVTYPLLLPAIVAGALLAFTLSLDDFVITFFVSGGTTTTLTVFVWGLVRRAVPPEINAISTFMIVASTLLIGISMLLQGRNATRA